MGGRRKGREGVEGGWRRSAPRRARVRAVSGRSIAFRDLEGTWSYSIEVLNKHASVGRVTDMTGRARIVA